MLYRRAVRYRRLAGGRSRGSSGVRIGEDFRSGSRTARPDRGQQLFFDPFAGAGEAGKAARKGFGGKRDEQIDYGKDSKEDCPLYHTLVLPLDIDGDSLTFGWGVPKEWADLAGGGTREYLLVFEKPEPKAPVLRKGQWSAEPFRLSKECIRDYFQKGYRIQVTGSQAIYAVASAALPTSAEAGKSKPRKPTTSSAKDDTAFNAPQYVQMVEAKQCYRIRGGCGLQTGIFVVPCDPVPIAGTDPR